jgi:hypothetical protein
LFASCILSEVCCSWHGKCHHFGGEPIPFYLSTISDHSSLYPRTTH